MKNYIFANVIAIISGSTTDTNAAMLEENANRERKHYIQLLQRHPHLDFDIEERERQIKELESDYDGVIAEF